MNNIDFGRRGEQKAVEYLKNRGYEIIQTNWRYLKFEVDIIARIDNTLVFFEVKTRRTNLFGEPYEAVNYEKQQHLLKAAQAYVEMYNINSEVRVDVISIIYNKRNIKIEHIENAVTT